PVGAATPDRPRPLHRRSGPAGRGRAHRLGRRDRVPDPADRLPRDPPPPAELTGDPAAASCSDDELRTRLAALPDRDLPRVLSSRELDDLERGYRERV